jgi:hypothetical protein
VWAEAVPLEASIATSRNKEASALKRLIFRVVMRNMVFSLFLWYVFHPELFFFWSLDELGVKSLLVWLHTVSTPCGTWSFSLCLASMSFKLHSIDFIVLVPVARKGSQFATCV